MTTFSELWPYEADCEWDAEKCFALFTKISNHASDKTAPKPNKFEVDDFCRQVMQLVSQYFGRNRLVETLDKMGLGASDVAQEVVFFIVSRVNRFKLRKPCYKTMIGAFNMTIRNRVADAIAVARPTLSLEETEMAMTVPAPQEQPDELADHPEVSNALVSPETFDELCGDLDPRIDGVTLSRLFAYQATAMVMGGDPSYERMPLELQRRVDPEIHATITVRLLRKLREITDSN